ncbi:MAG: D-glycero-beta-D-manno-heptose 1,7-bisphosphate 7-phosphatase [Saccharospirillaceae bacterium]|nr:D-glycero-beta-D-manno-heptose 1,7-bisphosphate 7-phosphatase [Saccharospirillaceae bacterium]MCD8531324.1 D-glycero-beta-D-manno-heptose 1,7-bisphosphate 7-phosphatase [Saccharospirillaceae bacterium]
MKLIILDRDGVLNEDSDAFIKTTDEWIPLPGSAEAVGRLTQAGYAIAIATNQSGVARGYFTLETLQAMHDKMAALAAEHGGKFAHIAFCPHGPDDTCNCRKPLPGLIHQIEQALGVSADGCWMVGDSIRDLEAGVAAGCKPALVRTGKGEKSIAKLAAAGLSQAQVFDDLAAFADCVLSH